MKLLVVEAGPNALADFQEPSSHTGLHCPDLLQGESLYSYLNLICHALLTTLSVVSVSEQQQRSGLWQGIRRDGKLQTGCKMNECVNGDFSVLPCPLALPSNHSEA